MTIDLSPAQEQTLNQLAFDSKRTPEQVVQSCVQDYLRHIDDLEAAVREGEESAKREGWLTHDEVFERLNRRFTKAA